MPTTAPAYTIGGITRQELHFDATGHIILEAVVVEFIALYGLKALFLGLPPGTPFQLVVPTLTVPTMTVPVDADVGANNVLEGAATGTLVGLTALATNTGGPAVTYSLTDNAGGRFQIDAATGVVTVANGALIDYDHGEREHTITVQATAGALSHTQTFTITLAAANDAPVAGNDALVATQPGRGARGQSAGQRHGSRWAGTGGDFLRARDRRRRQRVRARDDRARKRCRAFGRQRRPWHAGAERRL